MGRRGGYRKPPAGQPPSGPGRFSTRTDGNQAVRTPGLEDPSMQYGDVGRLRDAQRAAPVPKAAPARSGGASARPPLGRPPTGGGEGGLPSWLLSMPSQRPAEPVTDGLDSGPGRGSDALTARPPRDDRQALLEYLLHTYGNADAAAMLAEMRGSQTAPVPTPSVGVPPSAAPAPTEPTSGMEAADGGLT